jgi:hypothetical protein
MASREMLRHQLAGVHTRLGVVVVGREDDDRDSATILDQPSLKREAIHAGHLEIENEASRDRHMAGSQKLLCRVENRHLEPDRSGKPLESLPRRPQESRSRFGSVNAGALGRIVDLISGSVCRSCVPSSISFAGAYRFGPQRRSRRLNGSYLRVLYPDV